MWGPSPPFPGTDDDLLAVLGNKLVARDAHRTGDADSRVSQTAQWRGKKKVPATELKVGLSVVVDAMGDSEEELEAQDIMIVPRLKSSR